MTIRRAALVVALVAVLAQANALANGFALDDVQIIERNPVAHSLGATAKAALQPYWPREHGAGLWRPAVLLSFAADWQLTGGSAAWLHAVNLLLHAIVAALVVLILAGYASPGGALIGGLLFAVHPVHVEAVANLVGRAELLAAAFVLAALLLMRRIRSRAAEGLGTWTLELALMGAVLLGLVSKEHAVIAAPLLWLDDRARKDAPGRTPVRALILAALVTALWLLVRRFVDRGSSFGYVAPAFFGLGAYGRITTMMPAVLVMIRLLVWPWQLTHDYRPLVIERLEQPNAVALIGFLTLLALIGLAILLWKRNRAAAFALTALGLAWLPTSNLLFPTGIVVSERTLYLPSVGLALLAALAGEGLIRRLGTRGALTLTAMVCLALAARSLTRVPVWKNSRELVLDGLIAHPEAYSTHQSLAHTLWLLGRRDAALREYETASELFPLDPFLEITAAQAAAAAGRKSQALRHAQAAQRLDPAYAGPARALADSLQAPR